jgi:hypothetical protein
MGKKIERKTAVRVAYIRSTSFYEIIPAKQGLYKS